MVKKVEGEYEKPRFFRDRRDKEKLSTKRETPKSPPYERERKNWVVDGLGEDDFDATDIAPDSFSDEQPEG